MELEPTIKETWTRREKIWADVLEQEIQRRKVVERALQDLIDERYIEPLVGRDLTPRLVHLMQCLNCWKVGSPVKANDTVCGNCGSTETVMWFRQLQK